MQIILSIAEVRKMLVEKFPFLNDHTFEIVVGSATNGDTGKASSTFALCSPVWISLSVALDADGSPLEMRSGVRVRGDEGRCRESAYRPRRRSAAWATVRRKWRTVAKSSASSCSGATQQHSACATATGACCCCCCCVESRWCSCVAHCAISEAGAIVTAVTAKAGERRK